jgi:hypothetical protein
MMVGSNPCFTQLSGTSSPHVHQLDWFIKGWAVCGLPVVRMHLKKCPWDHSKRVGGSPGTVTGASNSGWSWNHGASVVPNHNNMPNAQSIHSTPDLSTWKDIDMHFLKAKLWSLQVVRSCEGWRCRHNSCKHTSWNMGHSEWWSG